MSDEDAAFQKLCKDFRDAIHEFSHEFLKEIGITKLVIWINKKLEGGKE